ncbi:RelA/SpoT domain-containing protein [Leifsonia sp. WHRI 6310E]|uniref:GTP pyrophosphokinase n=1 Tax=Leifsonia sp. WHRI 6310E TaxID=3162562 RepID=UPI0032ED027F
MTFAEKLAKDFENRRSHLEAAAKMLNARLVDILAGVPHVDRVSFRVKTSESFVHKCADESGNRRVGADGNLKYQEPLAEVEDQIAGRVLVFFRDDLEVVESRIRDAFRAAVEFRRREPATAAAFGYESDHFIFVIDEHMKPDGWERLEPMPATFELQVRTLFMHAFAEPQHDIGYKGHEPLDSEVEREFAWIAASAWGADRTMNELYQRLTLR